MASLSIVRRVLWMIWTERALSPPPALLASSVRTWVESQHAKVDAAERRKNMQTQRLPIARECRRMQTGPDDVLEPVLREALESPRLHGEGKAGLGLRDQKRQLVSDVLAGLAVIGRSYGTRSRGNAFRRSGTLAYGRPAIRVAGLL